MISEGSSDTEDWVSMSIERVLMLKIQLCITGINYILKYIQVEKYTVYYFNCGNIS